jgi:hypothetical protein
MRANELKLTPETVDLDTLIVKPRWLLAKILTLGSAYQFNDYMVDRIEFPQFVKPGFLFTKAKPDYEKINQLLLAAGFTDCSDQGDYKR